MRIVRITVFWLLAFFSAFLACGFLMSFFVAAVPLGVIFGAVSLASAGEALKAGFKRFR